MGGVVLTTELATTAASTADRWDSKQCQYCRQPKDDLLDDFDAESNDSVKPLSKNERKDSDSSIKYIQKEVSV
jgi:hypothetical protein